MAKKVYAIKEGFDANNNRKIENVIVDTWAECLRYVNGVRGAKYKSFLSLREAEEYLGTADPLLRKRTSDYPLDAVHSYVDGSFNEATGKYSYAIVMVKNDVVFYIEYGSAKDDSERDIRQIGGELSAAVKSLEYCIREGIKELVIVHDYEGVCYHATGYWERREESSQSYYTTMNRLLGESGIKLSFLKVDSHTGDLFNEMADEFAKVAAGIEVKGETKKYLKNKGIMVKDKAIKEEITVIAGHEYVDNVIIAEC